VIRSRISLSTSVVAILTICSAWALLAQAQDAPSVRVPPDQRTLSDILSKYNDLDAVAPNRIQRDRLSEEFRKQFCAHIPTGDVSGWIGAIGSVGDRGPDKSIRIDMGVNVFDLHSGSHGIELSIGNYYAYGVTNSNTQPHPPTEIPVGSPLYEAAANFRRGDVVRFNGTSSHMCPPKPATRIIQRA
jgi:hypothetical protein